MMPSRAELRSKQNSWVLNNKHMIILSVVKLQLMQAGRCVRRNRAWAECMLRYKPYTLCLLCTLHTHTQFSFCMCVWCVLHNLWSLFLRSTLCLTRGGTEDWKEGRKEGSDRNGRKERTAQCMSQFFGVLFVVTHAYLHVARVPLSLLPLWCLLITAKPTTDHLSSA